jgi:hypothetical protein
MQKNFPNSQVNPVLNNKLFIIAQKNMQRSHRPGRSVTHYQQMLVSGSALQAGP